MTRNKTVVELNQTHVQSLVTSREADYYVVSGIRDGEKAFHLIKLSKRKRLLLETHLKQGKNICASDYGKIIYSGWGQYDKKQLQSLLN